MAANGAPSYYYLKRNDTGPLIRVPLKNPDGSAKDLTGATSIKLLVDLGTGTVFSRNMLASGDPTLGIAGYDPVASDWTEIGQEALGEFDMEVEVVDSGGVRTTFPNGGPTDKQSYDKLVIRADLG